MRNMTVFGVDPGLTGGMAWFSYGMVGVAPMPTLTVDGKREIDAMRFVEVLNHTSTRSNVVYIEKVHAMPNQGVSSMFTFGRAFGELIGAVKATGARFELVSPKTWQKTFHLGDEGDPKTRSLSAAQRRYPDVDLLATERSKKPHSGIVDALGIMHYGVAREGVVGQ